MRSFRASAMLAVVACCISLTPVSAEDKIPYIKKSVWVITFVKTKPGKFDDYIRDLSSKWLKYINKLKEDGHVLSYKMLSVQFPRDNEPNLLLMTEYKNMASFDLGTAYWERTITKVSGSLDEASKGTIKRGDLRTLRGEMVLREIDFIQE